MKKQMNHITKTTESESKPKLTVGEVIRALRYSKEMFQMDLSRITGLEQKAVSQYETGKRTLNRTNAIKIAKALGVHPAQVMFPEYWADDTELKSFIYK